MDELRGQGWWFFGALLVSAGIRASFSMQGVTAAQILMRTGAPRFSYTPGGLYIALTLGVLLTALVFYAASRAGAPALLWLMPLALALMHLGGLVARVVAVWALTNETAALVDAYRRVVLDAPFASEPVWWAAAFGYPLAACIGSILGARARTRAAHA